MARLAQEVTDTGSNERGTYLRKNFVNGFNRLTPVDSKYSKHVTNENSEVVDVYCGKSSAASAVALVFIAVCVLLAL